MAGKKETVSIDGIDYNLADLSDEAKQQLGNIRVADQETERLNNQLAIVSTARNAYARALAEQLPKKAK